MNSPSVRRKIISVYEVVVTDNAEGMQAAEANNYKFYPIQSVT